METPKVTETTKRQANDGDDFISKYSYELGWRTQAEYENEKTPVPAKLSTRFQGMNDEGLFDYTKQLEFHKQEVAQAERRGMPQAQIDYHLGRIALLEGLSNG